MRPPALFRASLFLGLLFAACQGLAAEYVIERMKDNVYRFTAGNYRSAFMVTDAGIIATDPLNPRAAAWLKDELARRFDVPLRYVIYSHNHVDHSYGGQALNGDGVYFVAHRLARADLVHTRADTRIPDITFDNEMTLYLGEARVALRYHGVNNGRGSVSMHFQPANVMYVVDWIVLGRMPYKNLKGYDIQGMIDSTEDILATDFELFIGGHGDAGDKADVARYLAYLNALYDSVRDGMLAGRSLAQLQDDIRLPEFNELRMYDAWLKLNIEGVHDTLIDKSYFDMRPDVPAN
ncbi:beta-lactamase [Salinisphaera sp. C84B14]|uniref:MBL fold metallo-hydrolase n=1 Tax=Salinisphaera sp. C84B14 TaxID=1304155 RepID=UPI003342BDF8